MTMLRSRPAVRSTTSPASPFHHYALPILAVLAWPVPGDAQPAGSSAMALEEVVVTARKREESLQDVPLAVTAFNVGAINRLGIANANDINALAPSLYLTQTGSSIANTSVSIRGIASSDTVLTRDLAVGLYLDGVILARNTGALFDLVQLERVEVLRGPQGTLYGRNTTAGAINLITADPAETFGLEQKLTFGNYGRFLSRTTVDTGALGDTGLAATVTYLHNQQDGYVNNRLVGDDKDPGAVDTDAGRLALLWRPNDSLSVDYTFAYHDLSGYSPTFQLMVLTPQLNDILTNAGTPPEFSLDRLDDLSLDAPGRSAHQIRGHNLTVTFDAGAATLKSITSYREWENREGLTDNDGNAGLMAQAIDFTAPGFGFPAQLRQVPLFHLEQFREQDQFTQEFQLLGTVGEDLDYVAGVYYFIEDVSEQLISPLMAPDVSATFAVPGPLPAILVPQQRYAQESESWAVFGQGTYRLPVFEQRLSLTLGGRYTVDKKTLEQDLPLIRNQDEKFENFDWRISLDVDWTDDIRTYASIATGYRAGGFNPRSGIGGEAYGEETLITYEVGAKTQWFDRRLRLNLAAYYSNYDDLQVDQFEGGSGGASSLTVNAGEATYTGFEADISALLTERLTLNLKYGYVDAEYDQFDLRDPFTDVLIDVSDRAKSPYSPDQTLNISLIHQTGALFGWGGALTTTLDYRYIGEVYWHAIDFIPSPTGAAFPVSTFNEQIKQDAYGVLNARVTLSDIPLGRLGDLELSLWGQNLTDEEYLESGVDFGSLGFGAGIFGQPRMFGIDAVLQF